MGIRFRKQFKIAPGIKLNISKSSLGLGIGKPGASISINTKGKASASVGIPGSGLSYTSTTAIGNDSSKNVDRTSNIAPDRSVVFDDSNVSVKRKGIRQYIPGFRSGVWWKILIACVYYLFWIFLMLGDAGGSLAMIAVPFVIFNGVSIAKGNRSPQMVIVVVLSLVVMVAGFAAMK